MQRAKILTKWLKGMAELVAEEAERNPAFAEKLDGLMATLPAVKTKGQKKGDVRDAPDIYAEHQRRGEEEFRFWLKGLDLASLKLIVKANGFDVTKTSRRWTEPEKFANLIVEQMRARLKRGSSFITSTGEGGAGAQPDGSNTAV